jgi:hypothetical protein
MQTSVLNGLDIYSGHLNGSIDLNGGGASTNSTGYMASSSGCSTAKCHGNDTSHQLKVSNTTSPRNLIRLGPGKCTSCHDNATKTDVPQVAIGDPHTLITRSLAAGDCDDCHPGGTRGKTHAKNGDSNVVAIPNAFAAPPAGWTNYTHVVDASVTGYVLGGDQTTGTTEAEICWNCHDAAGTGSQDGVLSGNDVSEWGTNTQTNGLAASANYNFGTLTGKNWKGATWTSAVTNFSYKTGAIQSIHTANSAGASAASGVLGKYTEAADAVNLIRCSYCHHVHDGTKPYLRGTWKGSPYPEDGAPWNKDYKALNTQFGSLPRAMNAYTEQGGYYIDENNPNLTLANRPTATNTWALSLSAGLCTACHGSTVDSMDKNTSEQLWFSASGNGHANAVIGGTGTASGKSANIFDTTHGRVAAVTYTAKNAGEVPDMAYWSWKNGGLGGAYGYRGSGGLYVPRLGRQGAYNSYNWLAIPSSASNPNQNKYHQFPCSKCHNPHASRLPKLLMTNCLDVNHAGTTTSNANAWGPAKSASNTYFITGTRSDANKRAPYWDASASCHRANDTLKTGGWNKVSPWGGGW